LTPSGPAITFGRMRYFLSAVGLILIFSTDAQETKTDSLQRLFETSKGDEKLEVFDILVDAHARQNARFADSLIRSFFSSYEISESDESWTRLYFRSAMVQYYLRNYEASGRYLDTAIVRSSDFNNVRPLFLANIYELEGLLFQKKNEYDSADLSFLKALDFVKDLNDPETRGNIYNSVGNNEYFRGDYLAAVRAYKSSLEARKKLPDTTVIASNYRNIGLAYRRMGDYVATAEYYEKALPFYRSESNQRGLANLLNSIGILYKELGKLDQALETHEEALAIRKDIQDSVGWAYSLSNLGAVYINKSNYGSALEVLLEAENLQRLEKGQSQLYNTLANIGICYSRLDKHYEARSYHEESLKLAGQSKDMRGIMRAHNNLANVFRHMGNTDEALSHGLKSLKISEETENKDGLMSAHRHLSEIYRTTGDYKKALFHYEQYNEYQFELLDEQSISREEQLEAEHNTQKIQKELEQSRIAFNALDMEKNRLHQRQSTLYIILIALLLTMVILVLMYQAQVKKGRVEKRLLDEKGTLFEVKQQLHDKESEVKDLKLMAYAEQLSQQNQMISEFEKKMTELNEQTQSQHRVELDTITSGLTSRASGSISWEEFRLRFDTVHKNFVSDLTQKHENLTNNELDISILIKINLMNKDMAGILGVTHEGVKKSIQRLYRKLGLGSADELRAYMLRI